MINFRYLFCFLECGHFCINYILKKSNKKRKYKYNKMMMDLLTIKDVLLKYFNRVDCFKNYKLELINSRVLTLIKVRENYHYVVIEKVDENFIYYYDPLFVNLKKLRKDKFVSRWSKIVCKFN